MNRVIHPQQMSTIKWIVFTVVMLATIFATVLTAQTPQKKMPASSQESISPSAPPAAQTLTETVKTVPSASTWKCGMAGPPTVTFVGNKIYWTDYSTGSVVKAPLSGGTATIIVSGQYGACAITADESNIYWTNSLEGTVMKMPVNGGHLDIVALGQRQPSEISVTSGYIAWMTADGPHTADMKASDIKIGDIKLRGTLKMASDDSNAGGGTNPGTVKCHVCAIYCTRYVPQIPKGYWESYICGWRSCPPCGA